MNQYNNRATTRRERYAVKSHKQIIALTTATVVTATIASTTVNVNADVISGNQSTDTATQTSSNQVTPKSDFENAQESEAQKLATLQAQQKADEEAKAQANAKAQEATEQANAKALADAQAKQVAQANADAQANAQKLADEQAANEAAKAQQAHDAQVAHDAEVAKQQQAATDFANQQAQESGSAQAQRDTVTNQYNADQQAAQTDATATDKAIDTDAKTATDVASTQQATANQNADAAQAKAQTDAQNQQASDTTKQSAENTKAQTAQKQANTKAEATAQKTVTSAKQAVDKTSVKTATPANPYADNFDSYDSDAPSSVNEVGNLPTKITDPKIPSNHVNDQGYIDYYQYFGDNDKTPEIKGTPTDIQQNELADYAVTLVNSYRATQGKAPVRWTKENQKAVIASAKAREEANAGFKHTAYLGNSATTKTDEAYAAQNLWFAGENLDVSPYSDLTMLSAKVNLLNVITAMIYQDGAYGNGHRNNFMKDDQIMGFAMQKDNTGDWPYVVIFQNAAISDNLDLTTDIQTTSTQAIETARGGNTQANKQALADAQAKLAQVKANNATALSNLQAKNQTAIDNINQAYADAIAQIKANHDSAISQNATNYANKIASIKADATAKHDDNATKLAETLANLKTDYETTIASIKDLSPEDLASKKATEKAAFDKAQATELATFEAQQAQDAKTFSAQLDTNLANLKAQLDADLATKTAQGAKNVAQIKAQNTDAYNKLVAANAKALTNLQTANALSYGKAKAESQEYLNRINPANAKPTPEPSKPDDTKPSQPDNSKPSKPNDSKPGKTDSNSKDESKKPTAKPVADKTNSESQAKTDSKKTTIQKADTNKSLTHTKTQVNTVKKVPQVTVASKTNIVIAPDNTTYIYDTGTKALNMISVENQHMNVTAQPEINRPVSVKQGNQVNATPAVLLPKTAKNQQHSNQAILISLFGLLGVSLYAPKHMKNKRFNA